MTEEEWIRFEFYVRSHLTRNRVKDVMKEFLPVKEVDDEMAIVVSGLTKLFIGELCDNGEAFDFVYIFLLFIVNVRHFLQRWM